MLREYLEGDTRKELRMLQDKMAALGERCARLEMALQMAQHQEMTDTQRLKMTPQGPVQMPWNVSVMPPSRPKSSFPRALAKTFEHLTDPRVLVILAGLATWLATRLAAR